MAAKGQQGRPLLGLALALIGPALFLPAWRAAIGALQCDVPIARHFAPGRAWESAKPLVAKGILLQHPWDSLRRVLVGLALSLAFGVPVGLLIGGLKLFDRI